MIQNSRINVANVNRGLWKRFREEAMLRNISIGRLLNAVLAQRIEKADRLSEALSFNDGRKNVSDSKLTLNDSKAKKDGFVDVVEVIPTANSEVIPDEP